VTTCSPRQTSQLLVDQPLSVDGTGVVSRLDVGDVRDDRLTAGRTLDGEDAVVLVDGTNVVADGRGTRDDDDWLTVITVPPHVRGVVGEQRELSRDGVREVLTPHATEGLVQLVVTFELTRRHIFATAVPARHTIDGLLVLAVANCGPDTTVSIFVVDVGHGVTHELGVVDGVTRPLENLLGAGRRSDASDPVGRQAALFDVDHRFGTGLEHREHGRDVVLVFDDELCGREIGASAVLFEDPESTHGDDEEGDDHHDGEHAQPSGRISAVAVAENEEEHDQNDRREHDPEERRRHEDVGAIREEPAQQDVVIEPVAEEVPGVGHEADKEPDQCNDDDDDDENADKYGHITLSLHW